MDFLAILVALVGGTIIFLALHKVFDINHFGVRLMVGMWTVCFIVDLVILTIIMNIIGRALGFGVF